jgi:hypothetical protein
MELVYYLCLLSMFFKYEFAYFKEFFHIQKCKISKIILFSQLIFFVAVYPKLFTLFIQFIIFQKLALLNSLKFL